MIEETIYQLTDLETGKCRCCCQHSDEILKGDGRCVDCIEEEKFFEETMKDNKQLQPW